MKSRGVMSVMGVLVAGVSLATTVHSAEVTAVVTQEVRPVLVRNLHNRLFKLTVTCQKPYVVVDSLTVSLSGTDNRNDIDVLEVFAHAFDRAAGCEGDGAEAERGEGEGQEPAVGGGVFRGHRWIPVGIPATGLRTGLLHSYVPARGLRRIVKSD